MPLASPPALLAEYWPAEQRGQALGLRASLIYLGLAAGPAVGCWLAGHFGRRSVFWMQLSAGILGAALVASGTLATSRTVGVGLGVALAGVIGTSNAGFALAAAIALVTATICVARPPMDNGASAQ